MIRVVEFHGGPEHGKVQAFNDPGDVLWAALLEAVPVSYIEAGDIGPVAPAWKRGVYRRQIRRYNGNWLYVYTGEA